DSFGYDIRFAPREQYLAETRAVTVCPLADLHSHLHRVRARHDLDVDDFAASQNPQVDGLIEFVTQRDHHWVRDVGELHLAAGGDPQVDEARPEHVSL